jgi:hypothetical protein
MSSSRLNRGAREIFSSVGGFGGGSWSVVVGLFAQTFNDRERQCGAGDGRESSSRVNISGIGG